jgi:hypothetical protein
MPLELNGKPFTITDEETLRKYSKEYVFTAAKQYVRRNNDPEASRPLDVAPVHLPTSYNLYMLENGVRKSLGLLRYYDAHTTYVDNGRVQDNYTPQYIAIGHSGVMKSQNVEMNFFIDNAPFNQKVKDSALHPNHQPAATVICNTFSRIEKATADMATHKKASKLMALLLDDKVYPTDRIRSLAHVINQQASARQMQTKLWDYDTMEDVSLRSELCRLAMAYATSIDEIMNMESTDITDEVVKWKKLSIIEFTAENEWVFHDANKMIKPIVSVPIGSDPVQTLVYYLKNHDPYYKWYKPIQERYNSVLVKMKKRKEEEIAKN